MLSYDIVIVGAGPAGLMSAISAATHNPEIKISVVESGKKPARKLLLTGKGQCNLTHTGTINELLTKYYECANFLKPSLYLYSNTNLIDFFKSNGCQITEREDGKVFPASYKAADILNILLQLIDTLQITLITDEKCEFVKNTDGSFQLNTNCKTFRCKRLILAAGGKSYPKTGSDGSGYKLAKQLGHTVVNPKPALCALHSKNHSLSECSGISFNNVQVSIKENNRVVKKLTAPLLITHSGFTGPVILHLSRYISEKSSLCINFLPDHNKDEFLHQLLSQNGKKTVVSYLSSLLPKNFIITMLKNSDIDLETGLAQLSKIKRNSIISNIFNFQDHTIYPGNFNEAMVTSGGVNRSEVNSKTLESRIIKGLYFAGEILDIDGESGGYNLQAAFSTGYSAGKNSSAFR
jgi:predicted Rossmann fold flavoprotein